MDKWVKRTVLAVIVVNLLQLLLYPQIWNWARVDKDDDEFELETTPVGVLEEETHSLSLKRWPTISSYKPWTVNLLLKPYTCEAYFGHGFIDEYHLLKSLSDEREDKILQVIDSREKKRLRELDFGKEARDVGGSFRCWYSETLRTSICEGTHLVMDLEKIIVSRGGEAIDEVIGRDEETELPSLKTGAFQVQVVREQKLEPGALLFSEASVDKVMPRGQIRTHTLRSLLLGLQTVYAGNVRCSMRVTQPTVIVTRFEYANLFHTATDWFSAYISSRISGLRYRPHLVFLDGHCKSPMEDGWEAMFSSVMYAMHFDGPVCFDHAIFAPLGYDTPLFKHIGSTLDCTGCAAEELEGMGLEVGMERKTARLREFGEFFAGSFEPKKNKMSRWPVSVGKQTEKVNVLFVRREDYLAHPRHNGRPESRLSNEEEVFREVKHWAAEKSTRKYNVTIMNGLLAHMTLEEQIQSVTEADVLVGAHGAGLTHLVFAKPATIVLELSSPNYRRPHFETLSYWMGMDYHVIRMDSTSAKIDEVRKKMSELLEEVKRRKHI